MAVAPVLARIRGEDFGITFRSERAEVPGVVLDGGRLVYLDLEGKSDRTAIVVHVPLKPRDKDSSDTQGFRRYALTLNGLLPDEEVARLVALAATMKDVSSMPLNSLDRFLVSNSGFRREV